MCMQVALYAAYRRGRRIHYLTLRASAHSSIRLPNDQLPSVTFARMKLRHQSVAKPELSAPPIMALWPAKFEMWWRATWNVAENERS